MNELASEELEAPRSAGKLLPWVERRMEDIASTEEGKHAIRFREGLAKQLVEEMFPLGIFAMHYFGDTEDVMIQLVLGSQNYDAIIADNREPKLPFSYIEVTQAHEGQNERLRMLALEREGHVSTLGPVSKVGTKATGISVEVEEVALGHDDVRSREFSRVKDAILRKTGKCYPPDTALLVVFDDYISVKDDEDLNALRECVQALLPQLSKFRWLGVVGWSKRTYIAFDLATHAI
jgi:hypothetical protein